MSVESFSEYLQKKLRELDLTISALSRKSGISRQTIIKIKSGEIDNPSLETFIKLASSLKVSPYYLLKTFYEEFDSKNKAEVLPKYLGDYSSFVDDTTIPDNTIVIVGETFEKIWTIQNTGHVTWEQRRLVCMDDGDRDLNLIPERREVSLPTVPPGETVDIRMNFRAPPYPCTVQSHWKMVDAAGDLCFPRMTALLCMVRVCMPW